MAFEWDPSKAQANLQHHGVSFRMATVALSGPVLTRQDTRRDYGEDRFRALGEVEGTIIEVVFTRRAGGIRIISAWRAGRRQRRAYRALYPA